MSNHIICSKSAVQAGNDSSQPDGPNLAKSDQADEKISISAKDENVDTETVLSELSLEHSRMLSEASGISDAVIAARGYRTASKKTQLQGLGFPASQRIVPALVLPVFNVHGELSTYQIRPDVPRFMNGRLVKYETPRGTQMTLDVSPTIREHIRDPTIPLFVTEGLKKADALASHDRCAIALLGVWNWRGTNDRGGKTVLADFESVALNGRQTYLVFDSDVMTNPAVYQALVRLKGFLESRHTKVMLIYLPPGEGGKKQGVDDFLATDGHTTCDLLAYATDKLKAPPKQEDDDCPYEMTDSGIVWHKSTGDGTLPVQLTSFRARIAADTIVDDGAEQVREFLIEAILKGRTTSFAVDASQYASMGWVTEHLGADALLFPGLSLKDHARFAIQRLSPEIEKRIVFAHLGWREISGEWLFLHATGHIGQDGQVKTIEPKIPDALCNYELPDPPVGADLPYAIRQSMQILSIGPRELTIPLYGCVWRSVLAPGDFSVHVSGPTGHGKSNLAALLQQHFGARMDAEHLPANWTSTANALEALAFAAKDSLLVVDEFTPSDSVQAQALHRTAERLFRAAANGAGRQRMRADTTLRPAKPPRCFILSTGEDIPLGMSLRARMLIVEMEPNSIKFDQLTRCQSDAASGLYAQAMAGFIQWLTPQMGQINREWKIELAEIRQQATKSNMHRRTPENIASLMIGWRYFLRFAHEKGVIDESEHDAFCQETWEVLGHVASKQLSHQASSEPTARFLDLLRDSLASGKTYLKSLVSVVDMVPTERYGVCVGWDVPESSLIYLLPEASYAAAQEIGRQTGDPLTVSAQTLRKRLNEQGHIAETEGSQETLAVRKTIEGERIRVIVVYRTSLFAEPVQSVQPIHLSDEGSKAASIGQVFDGDWTGFDSDWTDCKTTPVHSKPLIDNAMCHSGQVGQENVERERANTRTTSDICPGSGQVLSDPSTNLSNKPVQSDKKLDESGLGHEEVF